MDDLPSPTTDAVSPREAATRRLPHHQQTVFDAGDETLDHDFAAFLFSHAIGGLDLFAQSQFERHAAAVIGVGRLDDHRHADVLGRFPGILGALDDAPFRHRHAAGNEQALGEVLVA